MRHKTLATLLIASAPIALFAQTMLAQDVIELEEISLSANLEPVAVDETGASVDILEEDTLEYAGSTSIAPVLASQAGVSLAANGGLGQVNYLSIRGANQNNIGVYFDGMDITDPSGVQVSYDFGTFLNAGLSRVEILKGSQGAVYGGEAIGGVISMVSKRATEDGLHQDAMLEYGSLNTLKSSYTLAYKSGAFDVAGTLAYAKSDGISAADEADGNTEADGFEGLQYALSGGYEYAPEQFVTVSAFQQDSTTDYDEGIGAFGDGTPDEIVEATKSGARVSADIALFGLRTNAYADYTKTERHYTGTTSEAMFDASWNYIGQAIVASDNTYIGERSTIGYKATGDVNEMLSVTGGIEQVVERYESTGTSRGWSVAGEGEATVNSVYGEAAFAPNEMLDVTLSARNDTHSEFDSFTTWRAAAAYRPDENTVLRASYGTGYRAPSNFELYSPYGEPTLQPEESRSFDVSAEYTYNNGANLSTTIFQIVTDELIGWDPAANAGWGGYNNLEGATTREGFEIAASAPVGAATVSANYTYTRAEDKDEIVLIRTPKHQANVAVDYAVNDALTVGGSLHYVADNVDAFYNSATFATERVELDDYTLINAQAAYNFGNGLEGYGRVENLFDTDYQNVYGYGTTGQAFYVGLRASF